MRAWRHSCVRIVHHVKRVVLVSHSAVLVMAAVHVVVCVVWHLMRCVVMTVQLVVLVNKLVVIITSIAKGRKVRIKGAHFMETVRIMQINNYMEISIKLN